MPVKSEALSKVLALVQANRGKPVTPDEEKAVRDRVSRSRLRMTQAVPFFGHLLLALIPVVTRSVPLAGVTRDRKLLLNPDWAMGTSDGEFGATLVHEVLHPAFLLWEREGGRTAMACGPDGFPVRLSNVAHDYVINLIIREMSGSVLHSNFRSDILDPAQWDPPGLIDDKYVGWSFEEVYDDLLKNAKKPRKGGSGAGGIGVFIPGCDESKADAQPDGQGRQGGQEGEGQGGPTPGGPTPKELDQWWKIKLVEAAQVHEQQKGKGTLPGGVQKIIKDILEPQVPWFEVLSRWLGEHGRRQDFTWQRPSRRSESIGELLPSMKKHGLPDVTVLWDTSGSMYGTESKIMGEIILGICEDLGLTVRVICIDAAIHSDQKNVSDAEDINVAGGGGSSFLPAFTLLEEELYDGVVVAFTDGMIDVPPEMPPTFQAALWVLWGHDHDPTGGKWGEVLRVDRDGKSR